MLVRANIFIFFGLLFAVLTRIQAQNATFSPSVLSPPRLSYDAILALPSPQEGDMVYDLTFKCLRVYADDKWVCSTPGTGNYVPNMRAIATSRGAGGEVSNDIAVDKTGNIYITGSYYTSATFGAYTLTSAGTHDYDIFVVKYNSSGVVQWARTAGGYRDDIGYGIAVDDNNNVYITGNYHYTAAFGDNISITSVGNADIFIAKYDSNGTIQWAQSAGGASDDLSFSIAADGNGNVYSTGLYDGSTAFGPFTLSGSNNIFIVKYDINGMIQWAKSAGGPNQDIGHGIASDSSGNVYVTGHFQTMATFGSITKNSLGGTDLFVAKYNTNGVVQWVQSDGGSANDMGYGITVDKTGNVYATGSYRETAPFGGQYKKAAGISDIFVTKYNSFGVLLWVQSAGGTNQDQGREIAVDKNGNVYVIGEYTDTGTFGTMTKTSIGGDDIFVVKYDSNGVFKWVHAMGGATNDAGGGMAVDENGNVYGTGSYYYTVTFDRNTLVSSGSYDAFLIRIDN